MMMSSFSRDFLSLCVRAFVLLRRAFVLFSQEFATLNYLGF